MDILKKNPNIDSEHDDAYYVIDKELCIMLMSDSYDQNGQLIDAADAGDNILILTDAAVDAANKAYNDFHSHSPEEAVSRYQIGDIIYAYDSSLEFRAVEDETKSGTDYERSGDYVRGFNFWNGNRWCSIIVERDDDIEPEFTLVEDEAIISRIKEALENKVLLKDERGVEHYEYENMRIEQSAWEGDFENYKVYID